MGVTVPVTVKMDPFFQAVPMVPVTFHLVATVCLAGRALYATRPSALTGATKTMGTVGKRISLILYINGRKYSSRFSLH